MGITLSERIRELELNAKRQQSIPTVSDLLSRVIDPENGTFSAEFARFLMDCRFPDNEQRRLKELAERQRPQELTAEEEVEMDRYIQVANLIELLKAKALASLNEKSAL